MFSFLPAARPGRGAARMGWLALLSLVLGGMVALRAELPPPVVPAKVSTTEDFKQLLLATKWSWKNLSAGVPDRICTFMADGTFRHPNFVAKYMVTGIRTVELRREGKPGKSTMTFDLAYTRFDAIDFDKKGITGQRQ